MDVGNLYFGGEMMKRSVNSFKLHINNTMHLGQLTPVVG